MNNMPSKKSIISLALGSAFAATLGTATIASAGESPFTMQSLNKGYMVADAHGYGQKRGEGHCGMSMADTDNDGRVSREENTRHCETMFGKMDANNDGYIDKDEAGRTGFDRKRGEGRCGMSMADADNDGRVSKEEHARHCDLMFSKMDANNDGYVDKDEANKMRKKHGHGHGHGHGHKYGSSDQSGYSSDSDYGTRASDRQLQHMKPMGE
jgi:uncharacterized low-complexity protein